MNRPFKKQSSFRENLLFLGFAFGLALSLGSSAIVYNYWRVALHHQSYSRATFTIKKLEFHGRNQWLCTAEGTIAGVPESTCLNDFYPDAHGKTDLKHLASIGSQLEVWYDPTAADTAIQGRHLRVLPSTIHSTYTVQNALWRSLALNGATIVFALMLFLSTRQKRGSTRSEAAHNTTNSMRKKNKPFHERTMNH
jgi:hypothetical protein